MKAKTNCQYIELINRLRGHEVRLEGSPNEVAAVALNKYDLDLLMEAVVAAFLNHRESNSAAAKCPSCGDPFCLCKPDPEPIEQPAWGYRFPQ